MLLHDAYDFFKSLKEKYKDGNMSLTLTINGRRLIIQDIFFVSEHIDYIVFHSFDPETVKGSMFQNKLKNKINIAEIVDNVPSIQYFDFDIGTNAYEAKSIRDIRLKKCATLGETNEIN